MTVLIPVKKHLNTADILTSGFACAKLLTLKFGYEWLNWMGMLLHLWLKTIISDTWAQDRDISSTCSSLIVKKFLLAEQSPKMIFYSRRQQEWLTLWTRLSKCFSFLFLDLLKQLHYHNIWWFILSSFHESLQLCPSLIKWITSSLHALISICKTEYILHQYKACICYVQICSQAPLILLFTAQCFSCQRIHVCVGGWRLKYTRASKEMSSFGLKSTASVKIRAVTSAFN